MEWEETLLESTCSIIEDIQKGNIDEYGYISNEYLSYYTHKSPTSSPTFDSNSTEYKSNAYASAKHYYTNDDEESSKVYYEEKESSEEYYSKRNMLIRRRRRLLLRRRFVIIKSILQRSNKWVQ